MKRQAIALISFLMCLVLLFGCSKKDEPESAEPTAEIQATAAPTEIPADITEKTDYKTQMWNAVEIPFMSLGTYKAPVSEVELDVVFTSPSGKEYTMPGFWDGDDNWKVRFAPNEYGVWNYKTVCTNASDNGLNGKTGTIACNAYKGDLEIYKHGFVTTSYGHKYFTYADGTPFFYLGDTHWSMYDESFDAGDGYDCDSHFKTIVQERLKNGFTVYQSEPINAPFNLTNGLSKSDIAGFREADRYYQYLAEVGLVHANAEFFFPSSMNKLMASNDKKLELFSRYWVARFGAYPVMWTMAQEVDNDYYPEINNHPFYDYRNNPWVKVAGYISKYDPYHHPLTAHQENTNETTVTGAGTYKTASGNGVSAFVNAPGHDWYASQWAPELEKVINFDVPRDYWDSPKIGIVYESRYCYLSTKDFGARAQGWIAYLNGMFGYGYGAQDIWCYNTSYAEDSFTPDGVDTVTPEEKQAAVWYKALFYESGKQVGYMKQFFCKLSWWKLTPSFNRNISFLRADDALYSAAADGSDTFVVYLYNTSSSSGTLIGTDANASYTLQWFNPRSNEYISAGTDVKPTERAGKSVIELPAKPDEKDWVLLATKNT